MSNKTKHNKVVILGLDGATFSIAMPWIKEGKLPVLAKLMKEGSWGNLKSTVPYNSAVAWSTFITGKNPGKHGIFDFRYRSSGSYDMGFVNSFRRKGKSLWRLINDVGKEVIVFNVPVTYPPEEVKGCLISGLTAPEVNEKIFYPPSLFKEVVSNAGMFTIKPFARDNIRLNRFDKIFKEMESVVDKHFKVASYLFDNKNWDFFCMVFGTTDHVQHFFWQHMDKTHPFYNPAQGAIYGDCIFKIYKKLDAMVGALIEKLDDQSTVFIISDHGAGANGNKVFYLNNWLAQEGFLAYKGNSGTKKNRAGLLKKVIFLAKKYIPRKYKNKLRGIPWLRSKVETIYWNPNIDWTRTKAFSYDEFGLIWINLEGREEGGIVKSGKEYEDVRSKIIEKALNFQDPESGEKIFSAALRKEEIYSGEELLLAPDIILVQKEVQYAYPYRISSLSKAKLPIETVTIEATRNNPIQTASHRMDGILIMKGPSVQNGRHITNAGIIDIAPTVLYLMGIPVPEDMDGKVIQEAVVPSYLNSHPISHSSVDKSANVASRQAVYSKEEEKQIEESLRALGYIE